MNIKQVSLINKKVVSLEKEPFGFVNKSNLQFALSEFNYNKRLDFYGKVSVLVRGISQGHPFVEGNKRTALIVLNSIFLLNKIKWTNAKKQQEDFMIRVAQGKYNNLSKLSAYLKRNT